MHCSMPFYVRDLRIAIVYVRDLRICGFWYPWGSWNQSLLPAYTEGLLNCGGGVKVIHKFLMGNRWAPLTPTLF